MEATKRRMRATGQGPPPGFNEGLPRGSTSRGGPSGGIETSIEDDEETPPLASHLSGGGTPCSERSSDDDDDDDELVSAGRRPMSDRPGVETEPSDCSKRFKDGINNRGPMLGSSAMAYAAIGFMVSSQLGDNVLSWQNGVDHVFEKHLTQEKLGIIRDLMGDGPDPSVDRLMQAGMYRRLVKQALPKEMRAFSTIAYIVRVKIWGDGVRSLRRVLGKALDKMRPFASKRSVSWVERLLESEETGAKQTVSCLKAGEGAKGRMSHHDLTSLDTLRSNPPKQSRGLSRDLCDALVLAGFGQNVEVSTYMVAGFKVQDLPKQLLVEGAIAATIGRGFNDKLAAHVKAPKTSLNATPGRQQGVSALGECFSQHRVSRREGFSFAHTSARVFVISVVRPIPNGLPPSGCCLGS